MESGLSTRRPESLGPACCCWNGSGRMVRAERSDVPGVNVSETLVWPIFISSIGVVPGLT